MSKKRWAGSLGNRPSASNADSEARQPQNDCDSESDIGSESMGLTLSTAASR